MSRPLAHAPRLLRRFTIRRMPIGCGGTPWVLKDRERGPAFLHRVGSLDEAIEYIDLTLRREANAYPMRHVVTVPCFVTPPIPLSGELMLDALTPSPIVQHLRDIGRPIHSGIEEPTG